MIHQIEHLITDLMHDIGPLPAPIIITRDNATGSIDIEIGTAVTTEAQSSAEEDSTVFLYDPFDWNLEPADDLPLAIALQAVMHWARDGQAGVSLNTTEGIAYLLQDLKAHLYFARNNAQNQSMVTILGYLAEAQNCHQALALKPNDQISKRTLLLGQIQALLHAERPPLRTVYICMPHGCAYPEVGFNMENSPENLFSAPEGEVIGHSSAPVGFTSAELAAHAVYIELLHVLSHKRIAGYFDKTHGCYQHMIGIAQEMMAAAKAQHLVHEAEWFEDMILNLTAHMHQNVLSVPMYRRTGNSKLYSFPSEPGQTNPFALIVRDSLVELLLTNNEGRSTSFEIATQDARQLSRHIRLFVADAYSPVNAQVQPTHFDCTRLHQQRRRIPTTGFFQPESELVRVVFVPEHQCATQTHALHLEFSNLLGEDIGSTLLDSRAAHCLADVLNYC